VEVAEQPGIRATTAIFSAFYFFSNYEVFSFLIASHVNLVNMVENWQQNAVNGVDEADQARVVM
jgi:hypothetical protein